MKSRSRLAIVVHTRRLESLPVPILGIVLGLMLGLGAQAASDALPRALSKEALQPQGNEDLQVNRIEVLRFVRNTPGSVVPLDLAPLAFRTTVWDLTWGPRTLVRSVTFSPVLNDASSADRLWHAEESFLDPAKAPAFASGGARRLGQPRETLQEAAAGPRLEREFAIPEAFGESAPLGAAPTPHTLGERWVATAWEGDDLVTSSAVVVGDGWAHLPTGPVRCFLIGEELTIDRAPYGARGPEDVRAYRYRWESPRLGTVAVMRSEDGTVTPEFPAAALFERLENFRPDAFPLRIYSDRIPRSTFQTMNWSYESGGPVSGMTPEAYATAGDLVNDGGHLPPTWEFTTAQDVSSSIRAGTQVPVSQSCYAACCGFSVAGNDFAGRSDNPANGARGFTAVDRVTGATDKYFFRAIVGSEGDATSELRSCFDGSAVHNTVVAYDFQHPDAGRFYMQKSDAWTNALKTCSQDVWQGGNCSSCTSGTAAYVSRKTPQTGITASVVGEGVLTLPSGHHFDSLLLQNTNDFTVYGDPFCLILPVQAVHQYTYAWLVPFYGNVATVSSGISVPDATSWMTGSTSLNYSLLPPVSISATAAACDRITLSWNPGNDASRITRYKVYWGTQSGAVVAYPFNSDANPGQVSFSGATATITGLARGTAYFFTVTSLADYAGHSYESLVYPTQISGTTPASAYPAEIVAATASAPTTRVTGVTVAKSGAVSPIDIVIAWNPLPGEACLDRYAVYSAADPRPAVPPGSFPIDPAFTDLSPLDTDGSSTNASFTYQTGAGANAFYLVVASTSGGQLGPTCSYPNPGPTPTCP